METDLTKRIPWQTIINEPASKDPVSNLNHRITMLTHKMYNLHEELESTQKELIDLNEQLREELRNEQQNGKRFIRK